MHQRTFLRLQARAEAAEATHLNNGRGQLGLVAKALTPRTHRRTTRTTNLLERLFVEERRRLKIIPNGFGEKPVLKLMFGALIRAAERWRGLRFTEFELRQIAAVRKELDAEYETKLTPSGRSSHQRFSSKSAP